MSCGDSSPQSPPCTGAGPGEGDTAPGLPSLSLQVLMGLWSLVASVAPCNYIKAHFPPEISFMMKTFSFLEYVFNCLAILTLDIK